jgi:hypothetical protein
MFKMTVSAKGGDSSPGEISLNGQRLGRERLVFQAAADGSNVNAKRRDRSFAG